MIVDGLGSLVEEEHVGWVGGSYELIDERPMGEEETFWVWIGVESRGFPVEGKENFFVGALTQIGGPPGKRGVAEDLVLALR